MIQELPNKLCQSCIERGFNPPNMATREWQAGVFYCDDCFKPLMDNLANINSDTVTSVTNDIKTAELVPTNGSTLEYIYSKYSVPKELQFESVDKVCRSYDKIFNFFAPAIINYDSVESLAKEIEERMISFFVIKYSTEPLEMKLKQLKEQARKEKGITGVQDAKEEYAKGSTKKSRVKETQEEKLAKALGMNLVTYQAMIKTQKEKEFNKMVGNCPECGNAIHTGSPCGSKVSLAGTDLLPASEKIKDSPTEVKMNKPLPDVSIKRRF